MQYLDLSRSWLALLHYRFYVSKYFADSNRALSGNAIQQMEWSHDQWRQVTGDHESRRHDPDMCNTYLKYSGVEYQKPRIRRWNSDAICHSSIDTNISGCGATTLFPEVGRWRNQLPTLFSSSPWSETPDLRLEFEFQCRLQHFQR